MLFFVHTHPEAHLLESTKALCLPSSLLRRQDGRHQKRDEKSDDGDDDEDLDQREGAVDPPPELVQISMVRAQQLTSRGNPRSIGGLEDQGSSWIDDIMPENDAKSSSYRDTASPRRP
jgi:hypothetical protein